MLLIKLNLMAVFFKEVSVNDAKQGALCYTAYAIYIDWWRKWCLETSEDRSVIWEVVSGIQYGWHFLDTSHTVLWAETVGTMLTFVIFTHKVKQVKRHLWTWNWIFLSFLKKQTLEHFSQLFVLVCLFSTSVYLVHLFIWYIFISLFLQGIQCCVHHFPILLLLHTGAPWTHLLTET